MMAKQANTVLASSHDNIKITTTLGNNQTGVPSEE